MKKIELVSVALVALMALSVVSAAGVLTASKAQAAGSHAPTYTLTVTQNGATVDGTHPAVTGSPVTVTLTVTQRQGVDTTAIAYGTAKLRSPNGGPIVSEWFAYGTPWLTATNPSYSIGGTSVPLSQTGPLVVEVWIDYVAYYPGGWEQDSITPTDFTFSVVTPSVTKDTVLQEISALQAMTTPGMFTSAKEHKPFDDKLTEVSKDVNAGNYGNALGKVQRDLMPKTDGNPKPADSVTAAYQADVYTKLQTLASDLQQLAVYHGQAVTIAQDLKDNTDPAAFVSAKAHTDFDNKLAEVIKDINAGN
jgi:hypothetical protein